MNKTLLGGAVLAALAIPLALAPAANATTVLDADHEGYVTVAWEVLDNNPSGPQKFATSVDGDNLDALDDDLAALSGCTTYQIDVYLDIPETDALIAFGTLHGEGSPAEPGVAAWKFITVGANCTPLTYAVPFSGDPTPATCTSAGTFVIPDGYVQNPYNENVYTTADRLVTLIVTRSGLTVDLYLFTNDGQTTLTGLSPAWTLNPVDGRSAARTITLDPIDTTSEVCIPDIGGKTIGFWTNKNGTAAGGSLWNAAKAPYANAIPAGTTFTQAQALLKVSGSTNNGKDMLRAQFTATALNVQYIAGYGAQHITVPTTSAVDGGLTVTVTEYLAHINAAWGSLDTKAEITSVKDVLDAINQDVASGLFV